MSQINDVLDESTGLILIKVNCVDTHIDSFSSNFIMGTQIGEVELEYNLNESHEDCDKYILNKKQDRTFNKKQRAKQKQWKAE